MQVLHQTIDDDLADKASEWHLQKMEVFFGINRLVDVLHFFSDINIIVTHLINQYSAKQNLDIGLQSTSRNLDGNPNRVQDDIGLGLDSVAHSHDYSMQEQICKSKPAPRETAGLTGLLQVPIHPLSHFPHKHTPTQSPFQLVRQVAFPAQSHNSATMHQELAYAICIALDQAILLFGNSCRQPIYPFQVP